MELNDLLQVTLSRHAIEPQEARRRKWHPSKTANMNGFPGVHLMRVTRTEAVTQIQRRMPGMSITRRAAMALAAAATSLPLFAGAASAEPAYKTRI